MTPLPTYYTRLRPFANYFAKGIPILTYHKVGSRPWGARLRGLYASPRFFKRQLFELHQAEYRTSSLDAASANADAPSRVVVLTFDDGFEKVFRHALEPLARIGFRAIAFLVADRLGSFNDWEIAEGEVPERLMDAVQVREWLAAGHEIGSHTRTHPYLARILPAQAGEEISGSKKKLEDLFGRPVRHFCYPYGDYSRVVADLAREAGYATACTTKAGLNTPSTDPYQLLRFTVRYPSRSLRALKQWLGEVKLRWRTPRP
jgi:peptidoglycan/xylan/chitin deacetylase (PgdA/CDA1 family)